MDNDEFFMLEAIRQAKKAYDMNEVPVGAVLVYENKIIAKGYNQVETLKDASAHAEMICLTAGFNYFNDWRLENTTLYCTLEPCIMCAGAIINSRVKRLVFSARDLRVGAHKSFLNVFENHPIHKVDITSGILENIISELMKDFFNKVRKEKLKKF